MIRDMVRFVKRKWYAFAIKTGQMPACKKELE